MRVIQRREDFGFTLEPRDAVRVRRHCLGEHLDGDAAPKLRVTRAIDFAHTAGAERRDDLVRAEAVPADKGIERR